MLKQLAVATLLALAIALTGCGSTSGNVNGNWTATLTNPDNSPAFAFTTTFAQGSGGALTITNLTFTTSGACFATGPFTETGTVSLTGDYNGHVTGSFAMTISTTFPAGTNNVLTLTGVVTNGTITGTWTLTGGTGCTGNGAFTATKT